VVAGSDQYDITERKRAEEQLTKLNRTLKALSNTTSAYAREDESAFLNEVCRIVTDDCGMRWFGSVSPSTTIARPSGVAQRRL